MEYDTVPSVLGTLFPLNCFQLIGCTIEGMWHKKCFVCGPRFFAVLQKHLICQKQTYCCFTRCFSLSFKIFFLHPVYTFRFCDYVVFTHLLAPTLVARCASCIIIWLGAIYACKNTVQMKKWRFMKFMLKVHAD